MKVNVTNSAGIRTLNNFSFLLVICYTTHISYPIKIVLIPTFVSYHYRYARTWLRGQTLHGFRVKMKGKEGRGDRSGDRERIRLS